MSGFEFTTTLVKELAWPVTVLIIVFLLREDIAKLVPQLRKVKAGPVEAEFEKEVRELAEISEKSIVASHEQADFASHEFLAQLAELHPRSAILESWVRVEAAARATLASNSTSVTSPSYIPASKLAEPLVERSILSPADVTLFHEIRRLRNEVAHAQGFEPTLQSAQQYIDLATVLLAKLQEKNLNV